MGAGLVGELREHPSLVSARAGMKAANWEEMAVVSLGMDMDSIWRMHTGLGASTHWCSQKPGGGGLVGSGKTD